MTKKLTRGMTKDAPKKRGRPFTPEAERVGAVLVVTVATPEPPVALPLVQRDRRHIVRAHFQAHLVGTAGAGRAFSGTKQRKPDAAAARVQSARPSHDSAA